MNNFVFLLIAVLAIGVIAAYEIGMRKGTRSAHIEWIYVFERANKPSVVKLIMEWQNIKQSELEGER